MELVINDRKRNREVRLFNSFAVNLKFDAIGSTFSFDYFFDPDNPEHKELSCIGHYHICKLTHNGETLLTGTVLSIAFNDNAAPTMVSIGGYSLPGVLEDSDIPTGLFPLQTVGLSLAQITRRLIEPFGIKLIVRNIAAGGSSSAFVTPSDPPDPAADQGLIAKASKWVINELTGDANKGMGESTAEASQNIKSYLTDLATQKKIVMTHDEDGNLVFTRPDVTTPPVAHFDRANTDTLFTSMSLVFDGQGLHSHITVVKQPATDGSNEGEVTLRNPYVINTVFRPRVIIQDSGDSDDTSTVCQQAIAEELKSAVQLTINIHRWDIDRKIIRPGSMVTVVNSQVYLYPKLDGGKIPASRWFVEAVDYSGDNEEMTAVLHCVLPDVYSGMQPQYLWTGINLH